jgi:hypothetical protein
MRRNFGFAATLRGPASARDPSGHLEPGQSAAAISIVGRIVGFGLDHRGT